MAINVPIVSEFKDKGIKDAQKGLEGLETPAMTAGAALEKAFLPAAAALAGIAAASVSFAKDAAEDQESAARLAGQLQRSTGATEDQVAAVEAWIASLEIAAGVADTDLRKAMTRLTSQTGDVGEAQEGLGLALDIAAATGKSLEQVTEALARAYGGNETALKRLDPQLESMIADGASMDQIFGSLTETFGGANAELMDTAAGGFRSMTIAVDNAKEAIGYALLPVMEQFLPVLQSVAEWVGRNTELVVAIGSVVGIAAGAIVAINVAMKAWAAATAAVNIVMAIFNGIMALNPVVLVVLAVVALIAIFVALEKRFGIVSKAFKALGAVFEVVKEAVLKAWGVVWEWFKGLWYWFRDIAGPIFDVLTWPHQKALEIILGVIGWIKENFGTIVGFIRDTGAKILEWITWPHRQALGIIEGIIRKVVGWFGGLPTKIQNFAERLKNTIKRPFETARDLIEGAIETVVGFFSGLPGRISDIFWSVADAIWEPFKWAFNEVAKFWNGTVGQLSFSLPSWIPGIGGKGFSMPQLPHLADGGIVTGPTIAMIGEAGPEAVIPLSSNRARGLGDMVVNITVTSADPNAVIEAIRQYERRNGRTLLGA